MLCITAAGSFLICKLLSSTTMSIKISGMLTPLLLIHQLNTLVADMNIIEISTNDNTTHSLVVGQLRIPSWTRSTISSSIRYWWLLMWFAIDWVLGTSFEIINIVLVVYSFTIFYCTNGFDVIASNWSQKWNVGTYSRSASASHVSDLLASLPNLPHSYLSNIDIFRVNPTLFFVHCSAHFLSVF